MGARVMNQGRTKAAALAAALVLTGFGASSAADINTAQATNLYFEEYIVTATRISEPVSTVPASVDVIKSEDIEARRINSAAEALQHQTGVHMSQAAEGEVMLRGFTSRDLLIMVNGQILNSAWNGQVDWNPIPTADIERIEVVRGAGSSLYGGQAVGGTINIITKSGYRPGGKPVEGTVMLSAGSHGTYKQSAQFNVSGDEHWFFNAGYEKKRSRGWVGYYRTRPVLTGTAATRAIATYTADLQQLQNNSYVVGGRGSKSWTSDAKNFTVGYASDADTRITYDYRHVKYRYQYNNPFSYITDTDGNQVFSGTVQMPNGDKVTVTPYLFLGYYGRNSREMHNLSYADDGNKFQVHFGMTNYYEMGYSAPASSATLTGTSSGTLASYPSKTYNFDMTKTWDVGRKHTLIAGIGGKRDSFKQTRYTLSDYRSWSSKTGVTEYQGGRDENYSVFVQDKVQHGEKWATYWGLRYDHYRKYDGYSTFPATASVTNHASGSFSELSPKFVLEYQPNEKSTAYVSYGHSFNPPVLYNVYRDTTSQTGTKVYANPDLKPETSDTFEIGYKTRIDEKSEAGVSLYYMKTKDTIKYVELSSTERQYRNTGESKRRGVEFSYAYRINPAWSTYLNYSWQIGEDKSGTSYMNNFNVPKHIFHAGAEYRQGKWVGVIDAQFVSRRQASSAETGEYNSYDPYFTLNTSVTYRIRPEWDVQFSITNVLDRHFYDEEATSGRAFDITTRYRF